MKRVLSALVLTAATTAVCLAAVTVSGPAEAQQHAPKLPPGAYDAAPPPTNIPPGKQGVCSIYSATGALLKSMSVPTQPGSASAYNYAGCSRALLHAVKPDQCKGKDPHQIQFVYVTIGTAAPQRTGFLCKASASDNE